MTDKNSLFIFGGNQSNQSADRNFVVCFGTGLLVWYVCFFIGIMSRELCPRVMKSRTLFLSILTSVLPAAEWRLCGIVSYKILKLLVGSE